MNTGNTKRVAILESANRVFSEKGFFDSTISDIANGAGMVESGVYKHFKGKEDILFTIPEEAVRLFLASLAQHFEGIKGAKNKLRKLIWLHCRYFSNDREYISVLLLECRSNIRFYRSKAYQLIQNYSEIIIDVIKEAMREGIISGSHTPALLRDMIFGTIDHAALNWVYKNGPSPLEQAEDISELIFNALRTGEGIEKDLGSKAQKRKRIIEVATKIFAEKGYDGATISEIAKAAGVADGTIYEYYKSKGY